MIRIFSCLQRHPSSGVLYFRRSVPVRLRPVLGRAEIKKSLNTCDKKVALPLAMRLNAEIDALFSKLEGEPMNRPKRKAKQDDGYISKITFDELILPTGAKAKGVTIDTGSDKKDAALAKELLGGIVATTSAATTSPATESAKLDKVAKQFRAEKMKGGTWRPKTAADHENVHFLLIQILGNVDVSTIGHAQARQFKEALLQLPANMTKGTAYAGKSVRQLLQMNIPDAALMHPTTCNLKIQLASSLFLWATRHGYCQLNPFQGLKMRVSTQASEERSAFDDDDLKAIFNPVRFNLEKLRKPFQYWLPLLALFTGGRAAELAQLRVCDVFENDGLYGLSAFQKTQENSKTGHQSVKYHCTRKSFSAVFWNMRKGSGLRVTKSYSRTSGGTRMVRVIGFHGGSVDTVKASELGHSRKGTGLHRSAFTASGTILPMV